MKRISLLAVALSLIAACTKAPAPDIQDEGIVTESIAFQADQEVTISVGSVLQSVPENDNDTRLKGKLNTLADSLVFAWENGDKIKVTVGTQSSIFTLSSGAGSRIATFTGNMPAAGTTFDVQFPVNDITEADLSEQTYVAKSIPKGKMMFKLSECTLGTHITLKPVYSVLQLNFHGTAVTLDSVVVTNTTATPTKKYKLACTTAVTVGSDAASATPFLLVVPKGTYSFTAQVFPTLVDYVDGSNYGPGTLIGPTTGTTFTTTSDKTFQLGKVKNMLPKEIKTDDIVIWAPVNCGYQPADDSRGYPYGKMYQWGRVYGLGYDSNDATHPSGAQIASTFTGTNGFEDSNTFYKSDGTYFDWISSHDNTYWNTATYPNDAEQTGRIMPTKSNHDPCPTGWRVPTYYEMNALIQNQSSDGWETVNGQRGIYFSGSNTYSASVPRVFLPAAGLINCTNGVPCNRASGDAEEGGWYWTSTTVPESSGYNAYCAGVFRKGSTDQSRMIDTRRSYGQSIRCVQE